MLKTKTISLIMCLFCASFLKAQSTPTLSDYCVTEEQKVRKLFDNLNLDFKGLEETKTFYLNNKLESACTSLLSYFEKNNRLAYFEKNSGEEGLMTIVSYSKEYNGLLKDTFVLQGVEGKQQRLVNGFIDWKYLGPNQDIEWSYFMNRHYFFDDLYEAWRKTGDNAYSKKFNALVYDWLLSNPVPAKEDKGVVWRALEAGKRATVWPQIYQKFQKSSDFTPVVRIMMLTGIFEHCDYLQKFHRIHHNHAIMEFYGIATSAITFPEFKKSEEWLGYIDTKMKEEADFQLYPDGAQKELTAYYHHIVIKNLERYAAIHKAANKKMPFVEKMLGDMYNYIAYSSTPQNTIPQNNDGDKISSSEILGWSKTVFNRPDWDYIASNAKMGVEPKQKSIMFPWAGQMIMRNGFKPESQYLFFDAGPWGIAHQHNDKLHFSISAYGREIMPDAGRLYYKDDDWRNYFNLSASHNVVLVDGKGQNRDVALAQNPLDTKQYCVSPKVDFAIAEYNKGFGDLWKSNKATIADSIPGKHTRAIVYLKDKCWLVFDKIETDKARSVSPLFHFAPDCTVSNKNGIISTTDAAKGNVLLIPVSKIKWETSVIKAAISPEIQGWYSSEYNKKEESTCVKYHFIPTSNSNVFAWLIIPFAGQDVPKVKYKVLKASTEIYCVELSINGKKQKVTLNFNQNVSKQYIQVSFDDKTRFAY